MTTPTTIPAHFPAATPDGPLYCATCGPTVKWPHEVKR